MLNLTAYAATKKRQIFDDLFAGNLPQEGEFSETTLKEGLAKGRPQMGATIFFPNKIALEFIYSDPRTSATILTVELDSPERIVMMPVPSWVRETIWQGEISGSHHFESEANKLLEEFTQICEPGNNDEFFGPQAATRRE